MSNRITNKFDPVAYSIAENEFLLEKVGLPATVALRDVPATVNRKAVKGALDRIYELTELQKHTGAEWVGVDAVKESIQTYLTQAEKWYVERRPGRPRFPSTFTFDQKGRGHRYGPGADSGTVKTYFDKTGSRKEFAVELVPDGVENYEPEWIKADMPKPDEGKLILETDKNRLVCPVCFEAASYNPESRGSFAAARSRMSKHLRKPGIADAEAHLEVYTAEFRS